MNTNLKAVACAILAAATSTTALAGASYDFHMDFTKGYGTKGQGSPSTYGDYDNSSGWAGGGYDDTSYIANSYAYNYYFQNNGVNLDVQAGVVGPRDNDGTGSSSQTFFGGSQGVYVGQFYGGLGVGWEINPGDLDDSKHTVDDQNGRDFLVLQFDQKVSLTHIDFDYFGPQSHSKDKSYADFQVYTKGIDGDLIFTGNIPYNWGMIEFGTPLEASDTYVIAPKTESGSQKKDYFKLRSVSGQSHPASVPSPTAALAGAALMAGLVCRRPKRKKAKT